MGLGLEKHMSKQFKTTLVLVFGIFLGISASLTGDVMANKEEAKGLPLDQLRNFSDIFSRIKSDYVEDVEDKFCWSMRFGACCQAWIRIQPI